MPNTVPLTCAVTPRDKSKSWNIWQQFGPNWSVARPIWKRQSQSRIWLANQMRKNRPIVKKMRSFKLPPASCLWYEPETITYYLWIPYSEYFDGPHIWIWHLWSLNNSIIHKCLLSFFAVHSDSDSGNKCFFSFKVLTYSCSRLQTYKQIFSKRKRNLVIPVNFSAVFSKYIQHI